MCAAISPGKARSDRYLHVLGGLAALRWRRPARFGLLRAQNLTKARPDRYNERVRLGRLGDFTCVKLTEALDGITVTMPSTQH